MGTQGTGRKRSTKKERSTAEDDALNLIAREAEARLAAKRAARAEAREIRMKELERQQKELSDDDERMSVGSRGSVRVEDRDYLEKGSRAASALTAGTLTSLGGTSSRRGSGETAITVDAETSIREIKDALTEVEEKYRKAMVSNAQLDNEKNNLMYQVDVLKDSLMELEEMLSESQRGHEDKVKELEREKHAHSVLQFQFNEMKETLKQSEELLNEIRQLRLKQEGFVREISDLQETVEWKDKKIGALERQKEYTDAIRIERDELREEVVKLKDVLKKHGIVLGPDLNVNGDVGAAEVDGSSVASEPAVESQMSPTEGNSMLGNTEATQVRSRGEEEVDPEECQEMFEEAKENHLSSDTINNVIGVSTLETPREEQPTEEQQTCLTAEENNEEESGLSKDLNVDINEQSLTEARDIVDSNPGLQGIAASSEDNVQEKETCDGGDLREKPHPDFEGKETKSSNTETQSDDIRESSNNKQEDAEESSSRNAELCHQQKVAQDDKKESFPDESVPAASNTESQQEPENLEETQNDEVNETSSKSQPQGAAASGKKKRKKRRGKKKGGTQEDKNQEKNETEKDTETTSRDDGPTTDPDVISPGSETLQVSSTDQIIKNEEVDEVVAVKPTETFSHSEAAKELTIDRATDEHNKEKTLETDILIEVEAVTTTETLSHHETLKEIRMDVMNEQQTETVEEMTPSDPKQDDQDEEQSLEPEKVEEIRSLSPVPEVHLSTPDLIDLNSKVADNIDGLDKVCTSSVDNTESGTDISANGSFVHAEPEIVDEVGSVDEMKSECTADTPENTDAESQRPSNDDIALDESEPTNTSESNSHTSMSSTNGFTDGLQSLSGPELNSGTNETPMKVSDRGPEEPTEREPGAETDQESLSTSVVPPCDNGDNSELKPELTENDEVNNNFTEPEGLVETNSSTCEAKSESCDSTSLTTDALDTEKETIAQAEQQEGVESQTLQYEDQIAESNAEVSCKSEEINTAGVVDTPDSPTETPESECSLQPDHRTEESALPEDPELTNRPLKEQSHEPNKDKSEDNDTSPPDLQDSDEEDGEDVEGQSFDFDDMDVEMALATNLPENPKEEEVEVVLEESSRGSSELYQSNTESDENIQHAQAENNDAKGTDDGGNQVDTLDKQSEKQENSPEEGVAVDKPVIEEEKVLVVGELGEENVNQTVELQGEEVVLPKSADQVAGNKEPPQAKKDEKKNNKKGKAKGKEECKMS